ncbi:hypothetical protein MASR2M47_20270 [Draconibacterium sp.]|jgi:hypothetical protein
MSMDLLMDSYFIDFDKYKTCKLSVEKMANSSDIEIKEYANKLLKDKTVNPVLQKLKTIALNYTWIIWLIAFLLLISFTSGFETGFFVTGLFAAGCLLGYLIPMLINVLLKRVKLVSIWKELFLFVLLVVILYFSTENKGFLAFIVPFSIPVLAGGLLSLKK